MNESVATRVSSRAVTETELRKIVKDVFDSIGKKSTGFMPNEDLVFNGILIPAGSEVFFPPASNANGASVTPGTIKRVADKAIIYTDRVNGGSIYLKPSFGGSNYSHRLPSGRGSVVPKLSNGGGRVAGVLV